MYYLLAFSFMLLSVVNLLAKPSPVDGEQVGIIIMGNILHKDQSKNVALIKNTETKKVRAIKKGFVVNKDYLTELITEKYIIMKDKNTKKEYLVYQDKFAKEFRNKKSSVPKKLSKVDTSGYYSEDGFERKNGKIKMTKEFRDDLVKNKLSKVLMQATAEAHLENGQIAGFKLSQIDDGSMYQKAGLQDGDVIKSINGIELNNVAGAVKLLRNLKGSGNINLDYTRGGSSQKIEIDVQ